MIWLGDFNRHHRHWDDNAHTHLFGRKATREAEILLTLQMVRSVRLVSSTILRWSRSATTSTRPTGSYDTCTSDTTVHATGRRPISPSSSPASSSSWTSRARQLHPKVNRQTRHALGAHRNLPAVAPALSPHANARSNADSPVHHFSSARASPYRPYTPTSSWVWYGTISLLGQNTPSKRPRKEGVTRCRYVV